MDSLNAGYIKLAEQECMTLEAGIRRRINELRQRLDPFAADLAETPDEEILDGAMQLQLKVGELRAKRKEIAGRKQAIGL